MLEKDGNAQIMKTVEKNVLSQTHPIYQLCSGDGGKPCSEKLSRFINGVTPGRSFSMQMKHEGRKHDHLNMVVMSDSYSKCNYYPPPVLS
jgi:hypothetical protein